MTWPRCFTYEETVIFSGSFLPYSKYTEQKDALKEPGPGSFSEHLGIPGIFWTFYSVAWFVSSLDQDTFFCCWVASSGNPRDKCLSAVCISASSLFVGVFFCLFKATAGLQAPVPTGTDVLPSLAFLHESLSQFDCPVSRKWTRLALVFTEMTSNLS